MTVTCGCWNYKPSYLSWIFSNKPFVMNWQHSLETHSDTYIWFSGRDGTGKSCLYQTLLTKVDMCFSSILIFTVNASAVMAVKHGSSWTFCKHPNLLEVLISYDLIISRSQGLMSSQQPLRFAPNKNEITFLCNPSGCWMNITTYPGKRNRLVRCLLDLRLSVLQAIYGQTFEISRLHSAYVDWPGIRNGTWSGDRAGKTLNLYYLARGNGRLTEAWKLPYSG